MRAISRFVEREAPDPESVTDAARRRAAEAAVDALAENLDLTAPRIRATLARVVGTAAEALFVRELVRRLR